MNGMKEAQTVKREALSEAKRLEELWAGEFGNTYIERNMDAEERRPFWRMILSEFPVASALEVGCNIGANLYCMAETVPCQHLYGVDINTRALETLRLELPGVNAAWSPARELPFRDRWFDLVFTAGVLIHQPPEILPIVMSEVVRCSRRYVLCAEYYSERPTEVAYRGETGALFKRDFGGLYQELFPELRLLKSGFLPMDQGGWDEVTWWVFEKP